MVESVLDGFEKALSDSCIYTQTLPNYILYHNLYDLIVFSKIKLLRLYLFCLIPYS